MNSPEGKARAAKRLEEYIEGGKSRSQGGSPIMNIREMYRAANRFVQLLQALTTEQALSSGTGFSDHLSVVEAFHSMEASTPVKRADGQYQIDIRFTADLSRPSLEPAKYGGVDNIVALFNNGYDAPNARYVRGQWHGEKVRALPRRDGKHFMREAESQFRREYRSRGVTTKIDPIYK